MNWFIKKVARVLLIVAVISGGILSGTSVVWAQNKGSLAKQIQGTWTLVSIYNEQDGKKTELFGPNPRGLLVLHPNGRFSIITMRASLPKIASSNRMASTAEENQAIVQGAMAFFGTYRVLSEKEKTLNLHMEGSTFPNWDGQDQKRVMTVNGDELKITSPHATVGGTNYSVWKRAK